MTDEDCLPVVRMLADTSKDELRAAHSLSPFAEERRRRNFLPVWNEAFFLAIQWDHANHSYQDVFVWELSGPAPAFLYSKDILSLYQGGLFPTALFIWKNYLVLMPQSVPCCDQELHVVSMIRVHDLSAGFELVGQYDLSGASKRQQLNYEPAHLRRLEDKAVALCRIPSLSLTIFIFSLPDCQLLKSVPVEPSLNNFLLGQPFQGEGSSTGFFHIYDCWTTFHLLKIKLDDHGDIQMSVVQFDSPIFDFDVNLCTIACVMTSGNIVLKEMQGGGDPMSLSSLTNTLLIPCPEELETESATIRCNSTVDLIVSLRPFVSGRKIHGFNMQGATLYEICLDSPEYGLESRPDYLHIQMDGTFLMVGDQTKIGLWNSKTGQYYRTITLPTHYNSLETGEDGLTRFDLRDHMIIVIRRNAPVADFPVAADIVRF